MVKNKPKVIRLVMGKVDLTDMADTGTEIGEFCQVAADASIPEREYWSTTTTKGRGMNLELPAGTIPSSWAGRRMRVTLTVLD